MEDLTYKQNFQGSDWDSLVLACYLFNYYDNINKKWEEILFDSLTVISNI